ARGLSLGTPSRRRFPPEDFSSRMPKCGIQQGQQCPYKGGIDANPSRAIWGACGRAGHSHGGDVVRVRLLAAGAADADRTAPVRTADRDDGEGPTANADDVADEGER